jgi:aminoacyl-tRNA hydrolase
MKYLIVGLGNIGAEYDMTRHNIGFRVADAIAARLGVRFETKRYGDVAMGRAKSAQIVLLKPSTYMNLSGEAVRYWMSTEKIPIERVLVIVDDLALPFGALRLKGKGSRGSQRAEEYRPAPRLAVLCPSALRYRE